jgi:integrase/recombinase XerD
VLGLESVKDAEGNVIQEAPLSFWANFRQRALDVCDFGDLQEKGFEEHDVPCHHNLDHFLDEYIAAAGIAGDTTGYLFRTTIRWSGILTEKPMYQQDAYRMIQKRAKVAGIETKIGNHTFRATGITAYLKNSGKLEVAQHIANHESPRTTKLYDRRQDEISLDEIERIAI